MYYKSTKDSFSFHMEPPMYVSAEAPRFKERKTEKEKSLKIGKPT